VRTPRAAPLHVSERLDQAIQSQADKRRLLLNVQAVQSLLQGRLGFSERQDPLIVKGGNNRHERKVKAGRQPGNRDG
jgi:hypothetical protein